MLNSIIETPITLPSLLICLAAAMILGVLTAAVFLYRSRHSASFALTLALLPMAVAKENHIFHSTKAYHCRLG